jgi:hypothetical protein
MHTTLLGLWRPKFDMVPTQRWQTTDVPVAAFDYKIVLRTVRSKAARR